MTDDNTPVQIPSDILYKAAEALYEEAGSDDAFGALEASERGRYIVDAKVVADYIVEKMAPVIATQVMTDFQRAILNNKSSSFQDALDIANDIPEWITTFYSEDDFWFWYGKDDPNVQKRLTED